MVQRWSVQERNECPHTVRRERQQSVQIRDIFLMPHEYSGCRASPRHLGTDQTPPLRCAYTALNCVMACMRSVSSRRMVHFPSIGESQDTQTRERGSALVLSTVLCCGMYMPFSCLRYSVILLSDEIPDEQRVPTKQIFENICFFSHSTCCLQWETKET